MQKTERTLIIMKPDCLQRNLVGEVVGRFERKGLKIIGMKMTQLTDVLLEDHYSHHKDKPFFADLKKFMKSALNRALKISDGLAHLAGKKIKAAAVELKREGIITAKESSKIISQLTKAKRNIYDSVSRELKKVLSTSSKKSGKKKKRR